MDYYDKVENDIKRSEFVKGKMRRRPLSTCGQCGAPIYSTDQNGEPYSVCYNCKF